MKICTCGNDLFNVSASVCLNIVDAGGEIEIVEGPKVVDPRDINGDIICTECEKHYKTWDDVPDIESSENC